MSVVIETNLGDFTIDLYTQERPKSCLNFLKLCRVKAFHFNLFHRVERNFIAQSGDPSSTGRGGESIFRRLYGDQAAFVEAEREPRIKHSKRGVVSFVNDGSDRIGSQFFVVTGHGPQPALDAGGPHGHSGHVVVGEVVDGFEVLDAINETYCDAEGRPFKDIRIFHTVVLDDPFEDPEGLEIPASSPPITASALKSDRLGVDDDPLDDGGLDEQELEERLEEKEARARATVLELVGDIDHVDDAPPENVLFVCKLNPVTTEEDLQIIFSRFGKILACDIITDRRTGDSLQYAFIEFENPNECERAYLKMDNVLIDDRRIHVDFSQSVAKDRWKALQEQKRRKKEGGGGVEERSLKRESARGFDQGPVSKAPRRDDRGKGSPREDERKRGEREEERRGEERKENKRDDRSGGRNDRSADSRSGMRDDRSHRNNEKNGRRDEDWIKRNEDKRSEYERSRGGDYRSERRGDNRKEERREEVEDHRRAERRDRNRERSSDRGRDGEQSRERDRERGQERKQEREQERKQERERGRSREQERERERGQERRRDRSQDRIHLSRAEADRERRFDSSRDRRHDDRKGDRDQTIHGRGGGADDNRERRRKDLDSESDRSSSEEKEKKKKKKEKKEKKEKKKKSKKCKKRKSDDDSDSY